MTAEDAATCRLPRRGILNGLLGGSVAATCASILYPVLRYLVPPEVPEAQTDRTVAARESDLKPNDARIFAFGSRPAIQVRTEEGEYRFLRDVHPSQLPGAISI